MNKRKKHGTIIINKAAVSTFFATATAAAGQGTGDREQEQGRRSSWSWSWSSTTMAINLHCPTSASEQLQTISGATSCLRQPGSQQGAGGGGSPHSRKRNINAASLVDARLQAAGRTTASKTPHARLLPKLVSLSPRSWHSARDLEPSSVSTGAAAPLAGAYW